MQQRHLHPRTGSGHRRSARLRRAPVRTAPYCRGRFNISDALTLDALDQADHAARRAYLRPMDTLLRTYPAARLDAGLSRRFRQGQRLRLPDDFQLDSSTVPPASWRAHDESLRVRVYD